MKITNEQMQEISFYMDDEIRERLHYCLAPCSNEYFLKEYCRYDYSFPALLKMEFGIEI